jgi:hypothetical protein
MLVGAWYRIRMFPCRVGSFNLIWPHFFYGTLLLNSPVIKFALVLMFKHFVFTFSTIYIQFTVTFNSIYNVFCGYIDFDVNLLLRIHCFNNKTLFVYIQFNIKLFFCSYWLVYQHKSKNQNEDLGCIPIHVPQKWHHALKNGTMLRGFVDNCGLIMVCWFLCCFFWSTCISISKWQKNSAAEKNSN